MTREWDSLRRALELSSDITLMHVKECATIEEQETAERWARITAHLAAAWSSVSSTSTEDSHG